MKKIKQSFVLSTVVFFAAILTLQSCGVLNELLKEKYRRNIGPYDSVQECMNACKMYKNNYTGYEYDTMTGECYCIKYLL